MQPSCPPPKARVLLVNQLVIKTDMTSSVKLNTVNQLRYQSENITIYSTATMHIAQSIKS